MAKKKDGVSKDALSVMRDRYERAVDAESDNREKARADAKFVRVQGSQWDEAQKKARKGRPCYEFPILRSHWRQVCNDQKQARPGIKISAVESDDKEGADMRQGIIRNIERVSNASKAYDVAFEEMTSSGFGAWRITTRYSDDDAFDQDLAIEPIHDAINRVWIDPDARDDDAGDAKWAFVEETVSLDEFKARYPKAEVSSFESDSEYGDWFDTDSVRIAEYWRVQYEDSAIYLLSDGRTVHKEEFEPIADELMMQGITVERERKVKRKKVIVSIVSGAEELEGPTETVFDRIPIVTVYGNRGMVDGKWQYAGMVRWSRDPQKLVNYNLTAAQEIIAKQPKSPHLLTPKMLEGFQHIWDKANAIDVPYLPYNPDPAAPSGAPIRLPPPDMPVALANMAQLSVDMLKASDGIYDAAVGARSNETSGRAIMARQREADTATFDYQDSLNNGIRATGIILVKALPKVYDTPRTMRILGRDGGEKFVRLYQPVIDQQTGRQVVMNDLSAGKYDVSVSTGASFSTQRAEFVEMVMSIAQSNPAVLQVAGDLVMGSMDFPKADEVAERLKLMLPPPIQAQMSEGKQLPPEVMQAQQQMQQMGQELQMREQQMAEMEAKLREEQSGLEADKAGIKAELARLQSEHRVMQADYARMKAEIDAERLAFENEQLKSLIPRLGAPVIPMEQA